MTSMKPSTSDGRASLSPQTIDGFLILGALSLIGRFCVQAVKAVVEGTAFCDYANWYLYSRLLAQGTAVYDLSEEALRSVQATMPVHVCGPANSSPILFSLVRLFDSPNYFQSLDRWLIFCLFIVSLSIPLVVYGLGLQSDFRMTVLAVIVLFLFPYLLESFVLGQTSMIVHTALAAFFFFLQRRNVWPAAVAGIAVVAIKINFMPVLLIPVALRNWRVCAATAVCGLGSLVAMVLALGTATHVSFIRNAMRLGFRAQVFFDPMNPSLQHTIQGLLHGIHPRTANAVFLGVVAVIVMTTVIRLWNCRTPDPSIVFSTIVAATLAITTFLEVHYLLFLFIPILVAIARIGDRFGRTERALFTAAFVLLAVPFGAESLPVLQSGVLVLVANGKLLGVITLWALLARHIRNTTPAIQA